MLAEQVELMGYFGHVLPLTPRLPHAGGSSTGRTARSRPWAHMKGAPAGAPPVTLLLDVVADAQLGDQLAVVLDVLGLDVGQEAAALADEHQEAATGVEVLLVGLHVLGELADAVGQDGDLDLGGAGVGVVLAELADELRLALLGDGHVLHLSFSFAPNRARRRCLDAARYGVRTRG